MFVCLKDYATALEVDLSTWTRGCDYDDDVYSDYQGYAIKDASSSYPDHAQEIGKIFSSSETSIFNSVRKIRYFGELVVGA